MHPPVADGDAFGLQAPHAGGGTPVFFVAGEALPREIGERWRARDPGPLAGVPVAVKNLFDLAGVTTLAGSGVAFAQDATTPAPATAPATTAAASPSATRPTSTSSTTPPCAGRNTSGPRSPTR